MIFKTSGKALRNNGKVARYGSAMSFIVNGLKFPNTQIAFSGTQAYSVTLTCEDGNFYTYNSFLANGGHGVVIFPSGSSEINSSLGRYEGPTFADGINRTRTVSISFSNYSSITYIAFNNLNLSTPQKLGIAFNQFTKLNLIDLNNLGYLTDIDDSMFTLPALTGLRLTTNNFILSSRFYGVIAPQFLNSNLLELQIGGSAFNGKTFEENKFSTITGSSLPNLKILGLQYMTLSDLGNGNDVTPIPASWSTLTRLETLTFNAVSGLTKIPEIINSYSTTLKSVNFSNFGIGFISWSNLSNLVNLTGLIISSCIAFNPQLPIWINLLTKLKNLDFRSTFHISRPSGDVDLFIDSVYSLVITNANISGTSSLPFRGMTVRIDSASGIIVQIPPGVLQQPTGYILGDANGNPTTSLEKIWVLINQYNHNWSYRVS